MAKRSKIGGAYNIPESIINEAERLGLDAMATGGNNDFIFKQIGENEDGSPRIALLTAGKTSGSPDRLNEKSDVLIALNENWTDQVAMSFGSAKEAMFVMSKMYDPYKT
jgi:hypothetical protein